MPWVDLWRTKPVEQSIAETDEPEHRLKKTLGTLDLIVFGVGVIIGAVTTVGGVLLTGPLVGAFGVGGEVGLGVQQQFRDGRELSGEHVCDGVDVGAGGVGGGQIDRHGFSSPAQRIRCW